MDHTDRGVRQIFASNKNTDAKHSEDTLLRAFHSSFEACPGPKYCIFTVFGVHAFSFDSPSSF